MKPALIPAAALAAILAAAAALLTNIAPAQAQANTASRLSITSPVNRSLCLRGG